MPKKLTVHIADSPEDSWLEIDGERVEGVESVLGGYQLGTRIGKVTLSLNDAEFVDERTGIEG